MAAERFNNRSVLRFAEEVAKHFSFLESLGFRRVCSEPTFIRFESRRTKVNIYHGRQSFEIGLEIESASSPANTYSFSEVLRLVNPKQAERYKKYATHTVEGVTEGVSQLADLFRQCTSAGILDDGQLFSRLKLQKKELGEKYAFEIELRQARRKSEAAWRNKDYPAVVEALKPLRAALTATEIGKLEFAEKHTRQGAG